MTSSISCVNLRVCHSLGDEKAFHALLLLDSSPNFLLRYLKSFRGKHLGHISIVSYPAPSLCKLIVAQSWRIGSGQTWQIFISSAGMSVDQSDCRRRCLWFLRLKWDGSHKHNFWKQRHTQVYQHLGSKKGHFCCDGTILCSAERWTD